MKTVMLIAGEASGDTLGAELVKAIKADPAGRDFRFIGAGGPRMAEAGVQLAFDLSAHAVVGIVEVLKNYRKFKGFFDQLLALAAEQKPDCVILIDYPGFNLRFAKALRQSASWKPKIVYYVSPQIWAWHESRVHQIARDIDLMLAIFPFEPAWYRERKPDFRVEFVGHPLLERYAHQSLARTERTLLLLPGSRERELKKHLPPMVEAARRIGDEIEMVVPNERLRKLAEGLCDLSGIRIQIGGLAEALSRARVAIASSGTVTMECAYFGVPTVVIYKTSWSTYLLGRRFIRVRFLAMPNLLAGEEIYPELVQEAASAGNIYQRARELLQNEQKRGEIKARLREVIASLGGEGASARAARAVLSC